MNQDLRIYKLMYLRKQKWKSWEKVRAAVGLSQRYLDVWFSLEDSRLLGSAYRNDWAGEL